MLAALVAVVGALIAGAFSVQLARQYGARRRHHALAWTIALGCYSVGMVALAVGFGVGWSPLTFGVYWLTGALLSVAFLAVGQLHLLDAPRALLWWTLGGLVVVWTLATMLLSPYDTAALSAADAAAGIPSGQEVFDGGIAYQILRPVTVTASVVVLAGCLWSGLRSRRYGILLIALGVAVSASSSAFLRAGLDPFVAVALTLGVAVMYVGFRAAAKPPGGGAHRARRASDAAAG